MLGRILSYDPTTGKGMLITQDKQKLPFSIEAWEDFDSAPAFNLVVNCSIEGDSVIGLAPQEMASTTPEPQSATAPTQESSAESQSKSSQAAPAEETLEELAPEEAGDSAEEETEEEALDVPESIPLSYTIDECVDFYFSKLERTCKENRDDLICTRTVDFLRMRRFITTAFNNLYDLDPDIFDDTIQKQKHDLSLLYKTYQDFRSKSVYPKVAYENVFLKRQEHFLKSRSDVEIKNGQISALSTTEKGTREEIATKEKAYFKMIEKGKKTAESEKLAEEVKNLKKKDVDLVHKIAVLKDEVAIIGKMVVDFQERYYEPFAEIFNDYAEGYDGKLKQILNSKAYRLDHLLWGSARESKAVREFFRIANIFDDFSSKTFLKYYINTLDSTKMNEENQKLHKLLQYMEKIAAKKVLIISNETAQAARFKELAETIGSGTVVKATSRHEEGIKWAKENPVDLFCVDVRVHTVTGFELIRQFKKFKGPEEFYTHYLLFGETFSREQIEKANTQGIDSLLLYSAEDGEIVKKMKTALGF